MVIRTEELRDCCSKILQAVTNSNDISILTETLQLSAENRVLSLSVTNQEYFVKVNFPLDCDVELFAAVKASVFLSLISKITTENVELSVDSNGNLVVKGNGTYKLAMIPDTDGSVLKLPEIELNNVTCSMNIDSKILTSILDYNSKELTKGTVSSVVQKLYYVDEHGAITYTSGACVNSFTLEEPVQLLFNNRLVKLFKLFKKDQAVAFELAYDEAAEGVIQTKVKFTTPLVELSAVLSCDDSLLESFPVEGIREKIFSDYPYSICIKKDALMSTIDRLMLFKSNDKSEQSFGTLEFGPDSVVVWDDAKHNFEKVYYANKVDNLTNYVGEFDFQDMLSTLASCKDEFVTLSFGDHEAAVISRGSVYNIFPEVENVVM